MTGALACDVSKYQRPIDSSYPHAVFICRHSDGDYKDPVFDVNWARARSYSGLKVIVAYHVYRPSSDAQQKVRADRIRADTGGVGCTMIDAETWGGAIKGNQSAGLNTLWNLLVARFGNNPRRNWGYANASDWLSMWPSRPAAMPRILAKYSSTLALTAGMVAQQYSDGQTKWSVPAGLPRSSSPFGPCDHNVFPAFPTGQTLADWIGGLSTSTPTPATPTAPTGQDWLDMASVDDVKQALREVNNEGRDAARAHGFLPVPGSLRADTMDKGVIASGVLRPGDRFGGSGGRLCIPLGAPQQLGAETRYLQLSTDIYNQAVRVAVCVEAGGNAGATTIQVFPPIWANNAWEGNPSARPSGAPDAVRIDATRYNKTPILPEATAVYLDHLGADDGDPLHAVPVGYVITSY